MNTTWMSPRAKSDTPSAATGAGPGAVEHAVERLDGPSHTGPASVGQRLRAERERRSIGLRELARRVNVSASLISQIELGRATPSVGTLYAIVSELGISLDELFFEPAEAAKGSTRRAGGTVDGSPAAPGEAGQSRPESGAGGTARPSSHGSSDGPVVRTVDRQAIHLGSRVTWERLSPDTEHGVDFLYVVYEVGSASAPERSLMRHGGREHGYVLEGRLGVTVGFETYELEPGDAIAFDSTTPHRLFNAGDVTARGIWCVVGRDDPSVTRSAARASKNQ